MLVLVWLPGAALVPAPTMSGLGDWGSAPGGSRVAGRCSLGRARILGLVLNSVYCPTDAEQRRTRRAEFDRVNFVGSSTVKWSRGWEAESHEGLVWRVRVRAGSRV